MSPPTDHLHPSRSRGIHNQQTCNHTHTFTSVSSLLSKVHNQREKLKCADYNPEFSVNTFLEFLGALKILRLLNPPSPRQMKPELWSCERSPAVAFGSELMAGVMPPEALRPFTHLDGRGLSSPRRIILVELSWFCVVCETSAA